MSASLKGARGAAAAVADGFVVYEPSFWYRELPCSMNACPRFSAVAVTYVSPALLLTIAIEIN